MSGAVYTCFFEASTTAPIRPSTISEKYSAGPKRTRVIRVYGHDEDEEQQ